MVMEKKGGRREAWKKDIWKPVYHIFSLNLSSNLGTVNIQSSAWETMA